MTNRNLDREIQDHLDLEAEELRGRGLGVEEARYGALRAFGNPTRVKEEVHDMSPWLLLEQLGQDVRFAVRTLRKNAATTAVAILSLALGVGANTAVFSLVDGVLFESLPYPQPDRLVRVTGYYPQGAVVHLQERARSFDVAGATVGATFNLTGRGEARQVAGSSVSSNLFALLGAPAALGRTFESGEDQPGRDGVVVLSHALWQAAFGADPAVLGRTVVVQDRSREVVGVMPPGFAFPSAGTELWIPHHLDPANATDHWGAGYMPLVARLRPEATLAQARSEVRTLVAETVPLFPFAMPKDWNADATVLSLQESLVEDVRGKLLVLLGAVGGVLLIACVNVAGLLLALASARGREMAVRAALGAGRARVLRQLLTESVVLAAAGGGLGIALAYFGLARLKAALPPGLPRLADVSIDGRVLAFATLLALATGLLFGVLPALRASGVDLARAVKAGAQRSADRATLGLRSALIVAETALAVVLVVAAGLLMRSLWRLTHVDPGFRTDHVLTARVSPSPRSCADRATCVAFYEQLLARARELPGVTEAAAVNALPLGEFVPILPIEVEGQPLRPAEKSAPLAWAGAVTPDYFRLLGIPVLRGRALTDGDGEGTTAVVVVSASTAERLWPGEDPIGKHVRVVFETTARTVVGVVGDVRQFDLAGTIPGFVRDGGALYMPYPQAIAITRQIPEAMSLLLRTSAPPGRVAPEIRGLVARLNPNVPVDEVRPLAELVSASTVDSRSLVVVFGSFGATALLLAAIGIYGVVSYATAQRTYEIGVRMALGATRRSVFAMTLGHGLRLALAGLGVGTLAALAATRTLSAFLYGTTATDPATFASVAVLLLGVALLAAFVPARRAASIEPRSALRAE
jgi:predicted permease